MKTREEIARFIESQYGDKNNCKLEKGGRHHYGRQESRELLDFIFGEEPTEDVEKIRQ